MITFCKKCQINWGRLDEQENEEEVYQACPLCRSSMDLEDGNDIVAYIMCPITGNITNIETGELWQPEVITVGSVRKRKVWDEEYDVYLSRREAAEDAFLDAYQKLCLEVGHEQAATAVKKEKVERLFHWETI